MPEPDRRRRLARWLIAVLVLALGFGIAVQVRSSTTDSLATARPDDLVRILDDQNARAARLRQQLGDLQATEAKLTASGSGDAVALQQAQQQLTALQVLLGLVPATGPGVVVTLADPKAALRAEDLLDVVQELRGAGAEAIQFDGVRVGVDSAFVNAASGVALDGRLLSRPYAVRAIGDPATLDRALNIVGGVTATVRAVGGQASVVRQATVAVSATRGLPPSSAVRPSG